MRQKGASPQENMNPGNADFCGYFSYPMFSHGEAPLRYPSFYGKEKHAAVKTGVPARR